MKKFFRISLVLLGILLLFIIGFAAFINFKPLPDYQSVAIPNLTVEVTPERVNEGRKLIVGNCAGCHKAPSGQFEGMFFTDLAAAATFGKVYTPNITQHAKHGIGSYTDGELYRLFRTGVKKNGQLMLPIMPKWVICSDEDIYAMIAYLRSDDKAVQPSDKQHPAYEPNFLMKMLYSFVFKPAPYKDQYPEKPDTSDLVAHGEYIVNATYGCYWCHSAGLDVWDLENPVNTPNYLGGGTSFQMPDYTIVAPSILMDGQSNVDKWSADAFFNAVKYGQRPEQPAYQEPMKPYVLLDTVEVKAIYAYLQAFKPQPPQ